MANWRDIEVNSKLLGHISAGIYRSPAGAIKELVSNAFDADATRVAITTNWPSFDIITCRDDGSGMTQEKFKEIMTGGIGDSDKRVPADGEIDDVTILGRPIIGWLGIGMLGVAQICHEFKVVSHHKETQTAFSARIRLVDFLREKVSEISPDDVAERPIDVGKYTIDEIDYHPDEAGTYVIASDMRSAFVRKFREASGEDPLPSRFSAFLEEIYCARSVKAISDYWQMVWELAVACPVPYVDEDPFEWDNIEVDPELESRLINLQETLRTYQFEVVVDGLSLRKPNQYPRPLEHMRGHEQTTGRLFSIDQQAEVYGQPLKFSGYIYLQHSRAVEPAELRGLLVRIRNIAIGIYDPTLFKFPSIPSPRFNWLSGEIYIEEGLEFALNIDRDSFNELHPHFVKLKEIVHHLLIEKVFPEAQRSQAKRSKGMRENRENQKQVTLGVLLRQELGGTYERTSTEEDPYPLTIDRVRNRILENDQSSLLPNTRSKRELIKYIAYAFEMSMGAPDEERRERFYQLLSEFVKSGLL